MVTSSSGRRGSLYRFGRAFLVTEVLLGGMEGRVREGGGRKGGGREGGVREGGEREDRGVEWCELRG